MPQYLVGLYGMPRRVADYRPDNGWTELNVISTVGAFIIGASFLFFLVNLWVSWRKPVPAGDNPWDGHGLEWFTTSPPPHHNYTHLPPDPLRAAHLGLQPPRAPQAPPARRQSRCRTARPVGAGS